MSLLISPVLSFVGYGLVTQASYDVLNLKDLIISSFIILFIKMSDSSFVTRLFFRDVKFFFKLSKCLSVQNRYCLESKRRSV